MHLLIIYLNEKEKEKKRNINNNLAILPSHDTKHGNLSHLILGMRVFQT